ncbi:MAG: cell division protein ZapE [Chromatiaceae bacterium]|nr:cell division protein ZapE [Chromatiaceae bacterium]MCP5444673.1 cell division protein ZapE [Chromatiaceae bacterium]
MTPQAEYQALIDAGVLEPDPAQAEIVGLLDALHLKLLEPRPKAGLIKRLTGRSKIDAQAPGGLYIWGSVGRGKTWLVDLFYNSLPLAQKRRIHFHRLMQEIHEGLAGLRSQVDPLDRIAEGLARNIRVLCLDEFIVTDIGDAMILAQLLKALFQRGVTLVTTSNTQPDNLYLGGIQRASFLPAIELLKLHTQVIELRGNLDYRLRYLQKAKVYHTPLGRESDLIMREEFQRLAPEKARIGGSIKLFQRDVPVVQIADDLVWFDFDVICGPPRSQADYLEIARCFHSVMISGIPSLSPAQDDAVRRFLYLLDEFYDRRVKLIISADKAPEHLYTGKRLAFEFNRAISRLQEMQSTEYLASPHKP